MYSHTYVPFRNRIGIEASRYLQDAYEKGNLETRNALFRSEVQKDSSVHIAEMALDKYMHYVLEKILDLGPLGHKQWIFEAVLLHKDQLWGAKYAQKIFAKCIEVSLRPSHSDLQISIEGPLPPVRGLRSSSFEITSLRSAGQPDHLEVSRVVRGGAPNRTSQ
jgi:hypothetical protein